ncbi:hypothetical protein GIS00_14845 [Nakamurella sp. YIM 132087]|uniref:Uncharacterized protein n=1 Tax=Nakamurella alba TaxID=2665158 RepID=A0A7K1FM76_9ACTN|nr:hypothetical protein [Nakamurella alba]MTD15218.1 hypothetical protein [Nakamurella alba]
MQSRQQPVGTESSVVEADRAPQHVNPYTPDSGFPPVLDESLEMDLSEPLRAG